MKFVVAMLLSFIAFSAQAQSLPAVKNVEVIVDLPGKWLTVQPTADIKVTINSCAERKLEVVRHPFAGGLVKIELVDTRLGDCRGPKVDHEYTLQISSDATGEVYVLLNPLEPTYK